MVIANKEHNENGSAKYDNPAQSCELKDKVLGVLCELFLKIEEMQGISLKKCAR